MLLNVSSSATISCLVNSLEKVGHQVRECGRWSKKDGDTSRAVFVHVLKKEGIDLLNTSLWPIGVYAQIFRGPNPPLLADSFCASSASPAVA